MLRKYVFYPSHVLSYDPLEIREDLTYEEQPERILQREEKVLQRKNIAFVNILWKNHTLREATWEHEDIRNYFTLRIRIICFILGVLP